MRRAAKADDNQKSIVDGLRECGCTVLHLHSVGGGCPDILVGFRSKNTLMEIKDGSKPPSARKLTKPQQAFHRDWRGQVSVVTSIEEAMQLVGVYAPSFRGPAPEVGE